MSNHHRLKQRVAKAAAVQAGCYLCRCEQMSIEQLQVEIIAGPGRVLWRETREINGVRVTLLCPAHQRDKEQRRDVRERRLHDEAQVFVKFAEDMPGLSTYAPGDWIAADRLSVEERDQLETRYQMFYGPEASREG